MVIKCPNCQHFVSDEAQFCTNCGHFLKKEEPLSDNPQSDSVQGYESQDVITPQEDSQTESPIDSGFSQAYKSSQSEAKIDSSSTYSAPVAPLPSSDAYQKTKKSKSNSILYVIAFLLAVIIIGIGGYLCYDNVSLSEKIDSDSVYYSKMALVQQQKEDSLMRVAKQMSVSLANLQDSLKNIEEKNKERTDSAPDVVNVSPKRQLPKSRRTNSHKEVSMRTGIKNLGYGTFKGTLVNGKAHDVNGRLIFKTYHQIDSRDPKGRMADPGDYVIGEFYDGHLVQGIWYDAYNQVKGSIIIGR